MFSARLNAFSATYPQRNVRTAFPALQMAIKPVADAFFPSLPIAPRLPARNFSAALLELGLHHRVEGLVRRSEDALHFEVVVKGEDAREAAWHYQRAEANFSDERPPRRFSARA